MIFQETLKEYKDMTWNTRGGLNGDGTDITSTTHEIFFFLGLYSVIVLQYLRFHACIE